MNHHDEIQAAITAERGDDMERQMQIDVLYNKLAELQRYASNPGALADEIAKLRGRLVTLAYGPPASGSAMRLAKTLAERDAADPASIEWRYLDRAALKYQLILDGVPAEQWSKWEGMTHDEYIKG